MILHEVVANLHLHTSYSDGARYHAQIAQAAAQAGIHVVIATDHNVWVDGVEGYYDNVLLLVGEEVHDVQKLPQSDHLLIYGAEREMAPHPGDSQQLIDAVRQNGGLCFLAHPIERSSPLAPELAAIPWTDWEVNGYTGIELWNYMSEFKALARSKLSVLVYALHPDWGIRGPFRHTLRLWDKLTGEGRRVVAIGGSDAHGNAYSLGPLQRVIFPYRYLFNCVNTHLLLPQPLSRELSTDKAAIYAALRAGHCFVGYDAIAPTLGFRFYARSGSQLVTMGDELKREAAIIIQVYVPAAADTRLLRDGRVVARSHERQMTFTTGVPGVYRVEVYRRHRWRRRGWIFSNPIYVY